MEPRDPAPAAGSPGEVRKPHSLIILCPFKGGGTQCDAIGPTHRCCRRRVVPSVSTSFFRGACGARWRWTLSAYLVNWSHRTYPYRLSLDYPGVSRTSFLPGFGLAVVVQVRGLPPSRWPAASCAVAGTPAHLWRPGWHPTSLCRGRLQPRHRGSSRVHWQQGQHPQCQPQACQQRQKRPPQILQTELGALRACRCQWHTPNLSQVVSGDGALPGTPGAAREFPGGTHVPGAPGCPELAGEVHGCGAGAARGRRWRDQGLGSCQEGPMPSAAVGADRGVQGLCALRPRPRRPRPRVLRPALSWHTARVPSGKDSGPLPTPRGPLLAVSSHCPVGVHQMPHALMPLRGHRQRRGRCQQVLWGRQGMRRGGAKGEGCGGPGLLAGVAKGAVEGAEAAPWGCRWLRGRDLKQRGGENW